MLSKKKNHKCDKYFKDITNDKQVGTLAMQHLWEIQNYGVDYNGLRFERDEYEN